MYFTLEHDRGDALPGANGAGAGGRCSLSFWRGAVPRCRPAPRQRLCPGTEMVNCTIAGTSKLRVPCGHLLFLFVNPEDNTKLFKHF